MITRALIDKVVAQAPLASSYDHGVRHWKAVAFTGHLLAQATEGADPELVFLFALFHDACRENEYSDPEHGGRAGLLAHELLVDEMSEDRLTKLVTACVVHDDGLNSNDPTIGCCWDADRLQLPRVGIEVDPSYLSTDVGCDLAEAGEGCAHELEMEWTGLLTLAKIATMQLDKP